MDPPARCDPSRASKDRVYAAVGGPNQVVSASGSPSWFRSPTQATYPSGRINTAVGAGGLGQREDIRETLFGKRAEKSMPGELGLRCGGGPGGAEGGRAPLGGAQR